MNFFQPGHGNNGNTCRSGNDAGGFIGPFHRAGINNVKPFAFQSGGQSFGLATAGFVQFDIDARPLNNIADIAVCLAMAENI